MLGHGKLVLHGGNMDMSRADAILEVFHVVLAFAKNSDMSQLSSISLYKSVQFHEKTNYFWLFFSRGCGGNANNFDTKQLCQKRCMPFHGLQTNSNVREFAA